MGFGIHCICNKSSVYAQELRTFASPVCEEVTDNN